MNKVISERTVEVPYVLDTIRQISPPSVLDVGFAGSWYIQQLIEMGIKVVGLDNDCQRINGESLLVSDDQKRIWKQLTRRMEYIIADITTYPHTEQYQTFPVVASISTIEHIVPCGYQNDHENMVADIAAVDNMKKLVSSGGSLILTFPCGEERFFSNKIKSNKFVQSSYNLIVYGEQRYHRIIDDWTVVDEQFWTRRGNIRGAFIECSKNEAFSRVPYASIPVQAVCAVRLERPNGAS